MTEGTRRWLILVIYAILTRGLFATRYVEGSIANALESVDDQPKSSLVIRNNNFDTETLKDVDNAVRSFEYHLRSQNSKPNYLDHFKHNARIAIAPARDYYDLARRYKNWRTEYKKLQRQYENKEDGKPRLIDAIEAMRYEYARIDKAVMEEACRNSSARKSDATEQDPENVDLIIKILNVVIDRLEKKLDDIRQNGPEASNQDDPETKERLEEMERSTKEAIDRVKRIATRSALDLVRKELKIIAEIIVLNAAASYVKNTSQKKVDGFHSFLSRLEPFVLLFGHANTPLAVSYLCNVRFRFVLTLVNSFVTVVQKCMIQKQQQY